MHKINSYSYLEIMQSNRVGFFFVKVKGLSVSTVKVEFKRIPEKGVLEIRKTCHVQESLLSR